MSMYSNVKMYFIAPEVVRMKSDVKDYLTAAGVDWEEVDNLQEVAPICNVLYMTRIQKERFIDNPEDYHQAKGKYILDSKIMATMKPDAIVMHPLPRVDEVPCLATVFPPLTLSAQFSSVDHGFLPSLPSHRSGSPKHVHHHCPPHSTGTPLASLVVFIASLNLSRFYFPAKRHSLGLSSLLAFIAGYRGCQW